MYSTADCELGSILLPNATGIFESLEDFNSVYSSFHPYIAALLCIVGSVLNMCTMTVLTRSTMLGPINVLLCAIAVCDLAVMTSYLPFVGHFLIFAADRCRPIDDYSYGWAVFTLIHAHSSVIFHAASIWLTVSLALIRVLTIRRSTNTPSMITTCKFSAVLAIGTWLIVTVVNLPNFLAFEIIAIPAHILFPCIGTLEWENSNSTNHINNNKSVITADDSTIFMVTPINDDCFLLRVTFWSNGLLFKVVPCLFLTFNIGLLLKLIANASKKRRKLAEVMKRKKPKNHTTWMLVAVLSLFLIAELPQGVMLVLTGIFSSNKFHQKIYLPLGDLMDLLSLINSSANFLIYCVMSRKFRLVFVEIFIHCYRSHEQMDNFGQNIEANAANESTGFQQQGKNRTGSRLKGQENDNFENSNILHFPRGRCSNNPMDKSKIVEFKPRLVDLGDRELKMDELEMMEGDVLMWE